jgi:hypothetical protein
VHGALLAAVHPDNTPHGYNLTFAFPMLMFIIVAGALYLRFRAAHNVPGHVAHSSSRWAGAGTAGAAGTVGAGSAHPAGTPDAAGSAAEPAGAAEAAAEPVQAAQAASEGTEDGE